MFKKMMFMVVVICSMVLNVNAQEATENLEKALNDPQAATTNEKNAEIKEITTQDAAKEKEDQAQLAGDTASDIKKEVDEDVAEDEALGAAEDKIETVEETPEPAVEEDEKGGSWFGWLWPFGGDDDKNVSKSEKTEQTEDVEETTDTETVTETPDSETVTEDISEQPVAEGTEEPSVADEQDTDTAGGVNVANKLIYYFPNLFLNLLDSFSARAGVGAKSGVKLSLTKAFQLGGNYGDEYFVEKGIDRKYGGGYDNGYSFELGPLVSEKRYIDDTIGSTPKKIIKQTKAKVQRPSNPIYKERYRNYWSVGVDAGWLINVGIHLNPIEFADFITGIFFYDLCDDDLGRTTDEEKVETSQATDENEANEEMESDETMSDDSDAEVADSDDAEVTDSDDAEATDSDDAEVTDSDDAEVTDSDDAEVTDSDDAEATDSDDAEATDSDDAEATDSDDAEATDGDSDSTPSFRTTIEDDVDSL